MLVSVGQKKELYAYVIMDGDTCLVSKTGALSNNDAMDKYARTIEILRRALLSMKHLFEANIPSENNVTIELSNSMIIKWIEACKVPNKYVEEFAGLMDIINHIPMTYTFLHEPSPQALSYVKEYKVEKNDIVGIETLIAE